MRASMGVRVDQRLNRDRRDVRGIDESFRAAAGRYGDDAFDDRHGADIVSAARLALQTEG
jgi:hypothetical protein